MKIRGIVAVSFAIVASAACAQAAARAHASGKKLAGYNMIVVKAFTIDKSPATSGAPEGLETMLHARAVEALKAKAIFDGVVDAAPAAPANSAESDARVDLRISPAPPMVTRPRGAEADEPGSGSRRVNLNGTVVSFSKGNRATRYLTDGLGAGESKLKMRFTLTDAKTGGELVSWTEEGTFKGTLTPFGGSGNEATAGAANGVVKRLLKEIEKNR